MATRIHLFEFTKQHRIACNNWDPQWPFPPKSISDIKLVTCRNCQNTKYGKELFAKAKYEEAYGYVRPHP